MNQYGSAFFGLTILQAALIVVMLYVILRFSAAAKHTRRSRRESSAETTLLSTALQDAVSKLKAQERAMSNRATASEQLNTQIVESLTAGLVVVAWGGEIDIFNAAGRRMLEVGDDPIGRDYREVLRKAPELVAVIGECLTSPQPIVRREVRVTATARPLHFGVTVSPLRATTRAGAAICLFSDLTTVIELEEQLRLKDTLARLGELTAGIAHEFRNGLATIHGYGRLIDPTALPAQYRPYVEGIRQEAEALGQVVTNFLNFARPEQIALARVDLRAIAQRAVDDLQHDLPPASQVVVDGTFGPIVGDEVLLRQVFGNLVRNAAEACHTAGRTPVIHIRGEVDPRARTCHVLVEDNGPGVPPKDRERIFQPFFTTRARGTGLGLSIVQKIVVMHNGRVSVSAGSTGGASVDLLFPLSTPDSTAVTSGSGSGLLSDARALTADRS